MEMDLRPPQGNLFSFMELVKGLKSIFETLMNFLKHYGCLRRCGRMSRPTGSSGDPSMKSSGAIRFYCQNIFTLRQAYHEIWLDGEEVKFEETEPIYGRVTFPKV